jgi:hypothetical protein
MKFVIFSLLLSPLATSFSPPHSNYPHRITSRTALRGKRGKRNGDSGSSSSPPPSKYLDLETIDWFDKSTNLNEVKNSMNDYAREYYKTGGSPPQSVSASQNTPNASSGYGPSKQKPRNPKAQGNVNPISQLPTPEVSLNDFDYGMVRKTAAR